MSLHTVRSERRSESPRRPPGRAAAVPHDEYFEGKRQTLRCNTRMGQRGREVGEREGAKGEGEERGRRDEVNEEQRVKERKIGREGKEHKGNHL
eukprot:311337-Hanusia_phi.AAC.1